MGNMPPSRRVAVIIPTRNRLATLRQALDAALKQTVAAEIFVMDDGSTDDTQNAIGRDYPQIRYLKETPGKGPTFQRNKAARLTDAEFIFTIDDDCVFDSERTIENTLAAFDHPRVAAVTIPFVNVLQDNVVRTRAPDTEEVWATLEYFGGMVAFRRDVYLAAGGYREYMFMQGEERDLAVRMLSAGYVSRLGFSEPLKHFESPVRDRPAIDIRGARNNILYYFYNVPWPALPIRLAVTTALNIQHGFKIRHPLRVMRGLALGYWGMVREFGQRKPVSRTIYEISRRLQQKPVQLEEFEALLPPIPKLDSSTKTIETW
jgi:glycosyltransferase involved in cell wall biosynthesis